VRPRVFVLGLDGATLTLLEPWAAAGRLPAFARLFREGAVGLLRSTIHPHTAPAWTSMMTARNPGGHGVYDFIERVPGRYEVRLTHGVLGRAPTLWSVAAAHGLRAGALNVPMTYPPQALPGGFMISGIDAPGLDAPFVSPPGLLSALHRATGGYVIAPSAVDLPGWAAALERMVEVRVRAVRYLLDHHPWDLFMVVFQATDMAQHLFWGAMADGPGGPVPGRGPFGDAVYRVYRRIDDLLGELLDRFGEETVLVALSDHGAGPLRKAVFVNHLLADLGLLCWRRDGAAARRWLRQALVAGKRHLPGWAKGVLKHRAAGARDRVESFLTASQYDWPRTRVFGLGIYGNLFFNLKGREPDGALDPADVDRVEREVTDALLRLRDPDTGDPVVDRVHRGRDLYRGPFAARAPDLAIQWRGYEYDCRARFATPEESLFAETITFNDLSYQPMTAVHRLHGFLALRGAMVPPGRRLAGASILDVTPTILHLLGLPVPDTMEGRVLEEALEDGWRIGRHRGPVPAAPAAGAEGRGYTAEEERAVRDRLHSLGYL